MSFSPFKNSHHPGKRFRLQRVACALCLGASFLSLGALAQAQPGQMAPAQADAKSLEAIQAQVAKQRKTDPGGALSLLEEFLQTRPNADPALRQRALADEVSLLIDLKQTPRALEFADKVMANVKVGAPETDLVLAQATKARALTAAGQLDQVEKLLDTPESWSRLVRLLDNSNRNQLKTVSSAINQLLAALRNQNKHAQVSAKTEELMRASPWIMIGLSQDLTQDLPLRLAVSLLKEGKVAESLSWAKYAYLQANFDDKSIEECTKVLTSGWAKSDDLTSIRAFAKAQEVEGPQNTIPPAETVATTALNVSYPTPDNPLARIKLPELVTQSRSVFQAMAAPMERRGTPNRQHHIVSMAIATGDCDGRLERGDANGAKDVARQSAFAKWRSGSVPRLQSRRPQHGAGECVSHLFARRCCRCKSHHAVSPRTSGWRLSRGILAASNHSGNFS